MPHFLLINGQQGSKGSKEYFYCFLSCFTLLLLLSTSTLGLSAEDTAPHERTLVNGLSAAPSEKDLNILIHCSSQTDFIPIEITNPPKIHIDIADSAIATGVELSLTPESYGVEVSSELISSIKSVRVEFILAKKYENQIKWSGNDLVLTLKDFFAEEQKAAEKSASGADKADGNATDQGASPAASEKGGTEQESIETFNNFIPDTEKMLNSATGAEVNDSGEGAAELEESGPIGDDDPISVDFYKIDLHNVFRMLRDLTGKNIVIAGDVSGTLTLALNDVPWRFALDIIVNLKDLAKMERDNTIVIYPKDKEFVWPQPEDDNLTFEEDEELKRKQGEGITITGGEKSIPPEQLEAKKLIAQGRTAEKKGDLETAIRFYEQALENWPKNTKLATKISTVYLVQLNQNAKAVFFAKRALEADRKNSAAALNAAIGYANMEEHRQAQHYFDQSVNAGKPSREALISYAVFSERQRQYDAALRLLKKMEELYGQDLSSMVAQARIYDALGNSGAARKKYRAILHAGFRVPPDLKKFILSKTRND